MTFDKHFLLTVALPAAEAAYDVKSDTPMLPLGFRLLASIKVDAPIGHLSPDNPYFGFVAIYGNTVFIGLRGTASLDEWLDDFDAQLVDVGGFRVHAGFQRVLEALLPSIRKAIAGVASGFEFCVIGHSLGAAVATLVAASVAGGTSLPVSCLVFASPRVGDETFRAHCEGKFTLLRIANTKDIVTHVPPRPQYVHAGDAIVFDGWANAADIAQKLDTRYEHSLQLSYTPGVEHMPDQLVPIELS